MLALTAHFLKYKALNDQFVLLDIVEDLDLSREEVAEVIKNDGFAKAVAEGREEATRLGIQPSLQISGNHDSGLCAKHSCTM